MREFVGIERLADYPRRGHVDFVGCAADGLAHCLRGDARGLATLFARKGIGIAGIDHQRAGTAMPKIVTAPQHRGRAGLGAGQHSRRGRVRVHHRNH